MPTPIAAEKLLDACAKFTSSKIPTPSIYCISFVYNGRELEAKVGNPIDAYFQAGGPVFCILERSDAFIICLDSRGVRRGEPILVGKESVVEIQPFE